MTEGPERQSLELALLVARANALVPLKGIAAPETFAALTAAKQLLDAGVGDRLAALLRPVSGFARHYIAARMEPALALAHQIIEVAERQDDPTYQLVGYRLLGTISSNGTEPRSAGKPATGRALPRPAPAKSRSAIGSEGIRASRFSA